MMIRCFIIIIFLIVSYGTCSRGSQQPHQREKQRREDRRLLNSNANNETARTAWDLTKWVSSISADDRDRIYHNLPVTPYAIVILSYKLDIRTFHWTKFLPADEFTIFFVEDHYQIDEILDFDVVILQHHNNHHFSTIKRGSPTNRFLVHIDKEVSGKHSYRWMSYLRGEVCAWDKAMFLLGELAPSYKMMWIFEEDVFIPTIHSFYKVHHRAVAEGHDLITNWITETNDLDGWLWKNIPTFRPEHIPLPYYFGLDCAMGMSWKVITEIRKYRNKFNRLDFHEALFSTISKKAGLSIHLAPEIMHTVDFVKKPTCLDFLKNTSSWFHPVKNQTQVIRKCIEERLWLPDFTPYHLPPFVRRLNNAIAAQPVAAAAVQTGRT